MQLPKVRMERVTMCAFKLFLTKMPNSKLLNITVSTVAMRRISMMKAATVSKFMEVPRVMVSDMEMPTMRMPKVKVQDGDEAR